MSYYTKRALVDLANLDQVAEELLSLGGVSRPPVPENILSIFDPSRSVMIARHQLGVIRGVLKPSGRSWVVIVNSRLPRGAQRFAIMHEGFHILQRTGAVENGHGEEYNEWLANGFAARILMPRRWMIEAARTMKEEQLSARFKVSYTALEKRLRELSA